MPYKVGKCAGVAEKMRTLADLAAAAGMRAAYLDALTTMYDQLRIDPLGWGDPLYRLHYQGGLVCHAHVGPIAVHYSVHEPEKTVLIVDIRPLFEWPVLPGG